MGQIADHIREHFPLLNQVQMIQELESHARIVSAPEGVTLMDFGSYIRFMPLVTKGAIKVIREDDQGEEVFLYYLHPGQSCAMTVDCCMTQAKSQVRAVTDAETEWISVPIEWVDTWMEQQKGWRDFVLTTYSQRFSELLHTIDGITFHRLDQRLLDYLHEKARATQTQEIHTTHQSIAQDLHSSREVISRLLKQLEKQGKIELGRNRIQVL
ncbi:Crp/Fnr family transcriptional regulator [bacterium SCSIO 12741]|nr:Crp/Fnr family transcriptional regulator [bacterium SCSIO 12741]